jgi:hypothetical protein
MELKTMWDKLIVDILVSEQAGNGILMIDWKKSISIFFDEHGENVITKNTTDLPMTLRKKTCVISKLSLICR